MGLIKHLLFWPYTGPKFLFDFAMSKVEGVVREELTDDNAVKAELLELQLKLELGDITDEEYVEHEAALMQRLRAIREWKEEFGMGVSGGPVRMAAPEEEPQEEDGSELEELPDLPLPDPDEGPKVARPDDVTIEINLGDWHQ